MDDNIFWLELLEKVVVGGFGVFCVFGGYLIIKNTVKISEYAIEENERIDEKYPIFGDNSWEDRQLIFVIPILGLGLIAVGVSAIIKNFF